MFTETVYCTGLENEMQTSVHILKCVLNISMAITCWELGNIAVKSTFVWSLAESCSLFVFYSVGMNFIQYGLIKSIVTHIDETCIYMRLITSIGFWVSNHRGFVQTSGLWTSFFFWNSIALWSFTSMCWSNIVTFLLWFEWILFNMAK